MSTKTFIFLLLVIVGCSSGGASNALENQLDEYREITSKADVVLLDGAVVVEKTPSYKVKWNSVELKPVEGKGDTYGFKYLKGGKNYSEKEIRIVTLIPLYEFREYDNPENEILYVKVNGKPVKFILFQSEASTKRAIGIAKNNFSNHELLSSQLDPRAPTLFIDGGILEPENEIKIEYELKPRSGIKVNRKIRQ